MTLEEIMVGKADDFPGLIGVVEMFLETLDVDEQTEAKLRSYLSFVRRRATGAYSSRFMLFLPINPF
jgi:glutamate--cysteine ligase catalytic subunit